MAISEALQSAVFVVPGDPDQNTGGYRYVRRIAAGLESGGLSAPRKGLSGTFPIPDRQAEVSMDRLLASLADGSVVVLDGLAMGALPDIVAAHSGRLRIVALVHHALADETGLPVATRDWLFRTERRALAAVAGVITTSRHTAQRLTDYHVPAQRIRVVEPGSDPGSAPIPTASPPRSEPGILCVAHLSPRKAQHHLVEALSGLQHLPWHCTLAGSADRDAAYGQKIRDLIGDYGLEERITLSGELDNEALAQAYQGADIFVLPSVFEGYGMVIDEALAAGLPIITTDGGALASTGNRPGIRQYPAGDVEQLRSCLVDWLSDPQQLNEMTQAAKTEAQHLRRWSQAAQEFRDALESLLPCGDLTSFDSDWLTLREPADHRARNRALMADVVAWAEQTYRTPDRSSGRHAPPLAVADLGTGTGSNARCLVPALTVPQRWLLLDQDEHLLSLAAERLKPLDVPLEAKACHLTAQALASQIPEDIRLITASALIDLMSATWLKALANAALARRAGVFVVLTYDGYFELQPAEQDDHWILDTVNAHQHREKGAGAALGPDATVYLQMQLQTCGYRVSVAPSPWRLEPDKWALQIALLEGWQQAVNQQAPDERERAGRWFEKRLAQARQQRLSIRVDHRDIFALPPYPASDGAG
ncbi:glycosyl transferase family 1 [Marinobacter vulgaris]|uniref:Glycosyl transferase family 1 n=1 Tax=Marinobacter vulgaris TaxID=1928331 RepID=A0A2V3ZJJ6_9GAMM|nr:glycosyltransferase family 4 protein [Marinobacter vulgaris]PXX90756.1 glycosyl transferase family 1 [Marinobacter vulgaris]TSJ70269.1 glycosyltransferase family 4 protein [Marinobacter vulgaris]